MKSFLQKTWKAGLSILFGLTVFCFWNSQYPAHLSYHEQYQLFLFDTDYWFDRIGVPGGLADYIAEFLTQFYYHTWMGAYIIALLYVVIQVMVFLLSKKQGAADVYYPLSFLPVIVLWRFMGDENAMLSFPVALLLALVVAFFYTKCRNKWHRIGYVVVALPLLYWAAGSVHFIFMAWVIIREFIHSVKNNKLWSGFCVLLGVGVLALLCPLLSGVWLQYPFYRLIGGINYYRFPTIIPLLEIVIVALFMVVPFLSAALPRVEKRHFVVSMLQVLALGIGGYFIVKSGCNMPKEEAMDYDRMARNTQWQNIIRKGEKKMPSSAHAMTCLNLALGKTGQLGDRMFEFDQNGTEGLLPVFRRDFTSPLPTSEVFYHLGMVNTAQRFTFEAMEAIPNFRKSGRCYKRLAETNLINGAYEVAEKYLHALQKTLFYKKWANETLTYLYNEEKINAHKEWGWIRQLRYEEDFLFSERETDKMLGLLYQRNYKNRMAFEYMLAHVLLGKDIERFMRYYPIGKYAGYDHIPRSYQEVLIYTWTQTHQNFQGMPWSISRNVMQDMTDFARAYTSQPNLPQALRGRFGKTYWYYLLCKK